MEKLRIVIDPNALPAKTEQEVRQMIEDAEIVYCIGIDPYIGQPVGQVSILKVDKTVTPPVAEYVKR